MTRAPENVLQDISLSCDLRPCLRACLRLLLQRHNRQPHNLTLNLPVHMKVVLIDRPHLSLFHISQLGALNEENWRGHNSIHIRICCVPPPTSCASFKLFRDFNNTIFCIPVQEVYGPQSIQQPHE
jgi:hypothetical protein